MNRKQATWQLLLVRAVLRRARELGQVDARLLERSRQIVDDTAARIEQDASEELQELLAATRADMQAG
jgi:hypothetical protein